MESDAVARAPERFSGARASAAFPSHGYYDPLQGKPLQRLIAKEHDRDMNAQGGRLDGGDFFACEKIQPLAP